MSIIIPFGYVRGGSVKLVGIFRPNEYFIQFRSFKNQNHQNKDGMARASNKWDVLTFFFVSIDIFVIFLCRRRCVAVVFAWLRILNF